MTERMISDEEIALAIEDSESDAYDDSIAEWEAERAQMDAEGQGEAVKRWTRERANVTCEELPCHLLREQATVALSGLACQIMTRGSIPADCVLPYALAWMERVGAVPHNGAVEDGGSLWWRVESEALRRQAGTRGLVWLCLSARGMSLKVPPGEVVALMAARAIPELTDEERAVELEDLRLRMERARRQRAAREAAHDEMEAREGRMWSFGQAEA